jgi:hypothetical protein
MTLEMGVAFDNSDYLNTKQKTTYLRSACSMDHKARSLSTKFEVDYFYQLSEIDLHSSLSRFQILGEFQWLLMRGLGIISGFTWDIQGEDSSPAVFITLSMMKPIEWKF